MRRVLANSGLWLAAAIVSFSPEGGGGSGPEHRLHR